MHCEPMHREHKKDRKTLPQTSTVWGFFCVQSLLATDSMNSDGFKAGIHTFASDISHALLRRNYHFSISQSWNR